MRSMRLTNPLSLESVEREGLGFLRAPVLAGMEGLEHAFMTAAGGVSLPPFKGLNFGGEDASSSIRANMKRLSHVFDLPSTGVATVRQVHGRHVVVMGGSDDFDGWAAGKRPEGDAIVTSRKGLAIGVLTADCVPVLFYDAEAGCIAVAHAGWRGFVAGVLRETLSIMSQGFGARAADIHAAIGPHIGPCCYEVSEGLIHEFQESGQETKPYFSLDDPGGALRLDLGRAVYDELLRCGLEPAHISPPGPCTSCGGGFYSYRRDGVTGRQLSFIMMR